jgi:hypothetical protein
MPTITVLFVQIFIDPKHKHESRQPVIGSNDAIVPEQSVSDEDSQGAIFDDGVHAELKLARKGREYMILIIVQLSTIY